MRNRSVSWFLVVLIAVFTSLGITVVQAQELVSANPRYARIIMPGDGSKGVSVIFDESAGTGEGYDTAYVDTNLDGVFSADEKFMDKNSGRRSDGIITHSMSPIYITHDAMSSSLSAGFVYTRTGKEESFQATAYRQIKRTDQRWNYTFSGAIKPSADSGKPFVLNPFLAPKVSAKTAPYYGKTGIGVTLGSAGVDIFSSNILVDISIKNRNGKVIKRETGGLLKFGFG